MTTTIVNVVLKAQCISIFRKLLNFFLSITLLDSILAESILQNINRLDELQWKMDEVTLWYCVYNVCCL